ncbi:APC family permease [Pseudothauera rhizosphaerae]|uniref:APC family permease n=1 Tax=Pseudothauera rhizosphaerae TaxID=2565932 RepID=A0A4S4AN70_9RHOO|nr:APC family permease [Pseudothauera rhizosphaerae]THF60652.1 APC family permease [Pseudothauera rhizosphaerae]
MSGPRQGVAGAGQPRASLSVIDGVAIMVGIVVGIGIFKTPPLVAASVGSEAAFIGAWLAGGAITLAGALVYAELAAAYPGTGGEYHFLVRAFGQSTGFLFAWARISVIQTGAIAAVAFVFGDYAQQIHGLGHRGAAIYAALALVLLTLLNLAGTFHGKRVQTLFTAITLLAVLAVALAGLVGSAGAAAPEQAAADSPAVGSGAPGLALVFILLTYGGWNEAAYLSAEVRDLRRDMVRILVFGTLAVTGVYVLVNLAFLQALGLQALRTSEAVGADVMRHALGAEAALALSAVICCAALSTLNGTIFTGARIYHALGQDMPPLRALGLWNGRGNNPRVAILVQSAVALVLIGFGAVMQDGFRAMVEYTAPVFWFFLLLVGIAYFVLRRRDAGRERPFRAPWYPLKPALFCAACAWLLYSSLVYTGLGALVGVAVLLLGVPFLVLVRRRMPPPG